MILNNSAGQPAIPVQTLFRGILLLLCTIISDSLVRCVRPWWVLQSESLLMGGQRLAAVDSFRELINEMQVRTTNRPIDLFGHHPLPG